MKKLHSANKCASLDTLQYLQSRIFVRLFILWRKQQFRCLISASFGCKCYCLPTILICSPLHGCWITCLSIPACPGWGITCLLLPTFKECGITFLSSMRNYLPVITSLSRMCNYQPVQDAELPACPGCVITSLSTMQNYQPVQDA